LQDDELFAVIETGASDPVLLVTSQYYDDGQGNQASIWCDVYYPVDGTVKNIGKLESMGTAYPISYDKNGIYVMFGNTECYEIDEKEGELALVEGIDEQSKDAEVVNFSYGASTHSNMLPSSSLVNLSEKGQLVENILADFFATV
jgi:hypothetical protein